MPFRLTHQGKVPAHLGTTQRHPEENPQCSDRAVAGRVAHDAELRASAVGNLKVSDIDSKHSDPQRTREAQEGPLRNALAALVDNRAQQGTGSAARGVTYKAALGGGCVPSLLWCT